MWRKRLALSTFIDRPSGVDPRAPGLFAEQLQLAVDRSALKMPLDMIEPLLLEAAPDVADGLVIARTGKRESSFERGGI